MKNLAIPVFVAGILMSGIALAAEAPPSIKSKGQITAAIMPNYPPMDFKDPATNKLTGLDYDLGNAIAERMGIKIVWQEISFEQMVSALTTKRVDIIMSGMTDTVERQQAITFVDYFTSGPQFYTLQKNADLNEIIDLCGKKVGTSRRTTVPKEIGDWSKANCESVGKPAIIVVGAEGTADARAQLRQSRLDAAVQGSETLPYIMKLDEKAYKALGQPILKQYFGLGVGKDNPELSKSIADTLQEMIVDGTYLAILKKWDLQEGAIERATLNLK